jgi:hypothetical protein
MVKAWLLDALTPLHLPVDVRDRIGQWAEEAARRVSRTETASGVQHAWMGLWISANWPSDAQTWGFFRVEKLAAAAENENSRERWIEFYIFPEGQ